MTTDDARLTALLAAEEQALALLDAIENAGLIAAGRSERAVEQNIRALAERRFGITRHWHKRIVRAGVNTLATAGDNPPIRTIDADDMVFLDLGPVLGEWEADVGRSYAIGDDPAKRRLCADLPRHFAEVQARYDADRQVTGADLYDLACRLAARDGWLFGGRIAGHIVAEFPHAHLPGDKARNRIASDNDAPLRGPDGAGRPRYWIIEIHLVSPDRRFGGFYERLVHRPPDGSGIRPVPVRR